MNQQFGLFSHRLAFTGSGKHCQHTRTQKQDHRPQEHLCRIACFGVVGALHRLLRAGRRFGPLRLTGHRRNGTAAVGNDRGDFRRSRAGRGGGARRRGVSRGSGARRRAGGSGQGCHGDALLRRKDGPAFGDIRHRGVAPNPCTSIKVSRNMLN